MASSNSDSEVEIVFVKKRSKHNVVNSDSSDSSDTNIRPITRGSNRKIRDSESSADEECPKNELSTGSERSDCKEAEDGAAGGFHDSSDGEQCEKCAICLNKFLGQDTATPVTCDHTFCSLCLQTWARKMNTCPIDRKRFIEIALHRHKESIPYRTIPIENSIEGFDNDSDSSDTISCVVCGDSCEHRTVLICDQCNLVYHRECINFPFINSAAPTPWWCPICAPYVRIRDRMVQDFQDLVERRFHPAPYEPLILSESSAPSNSTTSYQQNRNTTDSSLSDDSENDSELAYANCRRQRCLEIRNRRQNRNVYTQLRESLSVPSTGAGFLTESALDSDDEESYDFSSSGGNVVGGPQRRAIRRIKYALHQPTVRRTPAFLPCVAPPNLVSNILQLQSALHRPGSVLQRDGSISHDSSPTVQQCPLNPSQGSSSKFSTNNTDSSSQPNTSFASSSASGSGPSQYRDLYSLPSCSMVPGSSNADGYDANSCSLMTHRSPYLLPEESKRDDPEFPNPKIHSDDEVDIYSDIELTNDDEASVDTEMQGLGMGYKSEECHLTSSSNAAASSSAAVVVADGSDSSDNDLVIDEDMHVDDEREKSKLKPSDSAMYDKSSDLEDNADPNKTLESIQSPDADDDDDDCSQNSNSNFQTYNDSCCSYKSTDECKMEEESKDAYVDSDGESRDDNNSTGNEADEENSTHSLQVDSYQNNTSNDGSNQKLSFSLQITNSSEPHSTVVENCDDQKESKNLDSESETNADKNTSENENDMSVDDHCESIDKIDEHEDSMCSASSKAEGEYAENDASVSKEVYDCDESGDDPQDVPSPCDKTCSNQGFESSEGIEDGTRQVSGFTTHDTSSQNVDDDVIKDDDDDGVIKDDDDDDDGAIKDDDDDGAIKDDDDDGAIKDDDDEAVTVNVASSVNENSAQETNVNNSGTIISNSELSPDEKEEEENEHQEMSSTFQNMDDLGIEDISDAASDDLNQQDSGTDCMKSVADEVEKNVSQLFEQDSAEELKSRDESCSVRMEDRKRFSSSSRQSLQDDQEEGEIIDDLPFRKKDSRKGYFTHDDEDFMDSTPRVNISDLPRIPKIKRDSNRQKEVEEVPLEAKRTSVLGRVDLGSSDISWKRLSQHTRERSYRDGRPKDESLLFRDRELRLKERKNKQYGERKSDNKHKESERNKKEDVKKVETSKSRDKSSRDHKSERSKSEHEKSSKSYSTSEKSYSASEKRDKDKYIKSHERTKAEKHNRSQSKSERDNKKDKREKHKEKSSRDHDKYERDKGRSEEKYRREVDRYDDAEEQYERSYEKSKEKEYKHKHREHKSDNKKSKEDKKKRSHSSDQHSADKQKDREVRKIDDKLKIVVEHKKDKKHMEKKHEKKHRENTHDESKKKEVVASPFSDTTPTPIESKEIFTKGDSIIINVNFNRNRERESGVINVRDKKYKTDSSSFSDESGKSKSERDSSFSDAIGIKGPSTPDGKTEKLSIGELYWQETDDMDANSPPADKCSIDKNSTDKDDDSAVENFEADDNLSDSDESDDNTETQAKNAENFSEIPTSDKTSTESIYLESKEGDSFSGARRPHPPSPPSPVDNDSYDPCEPTRSPSVSSSPPPLPSKTMPDHPKPPPSPELPPLPPGPEPTDILPNEDVRLKKTISNPSPDKESPAISLVPSPAISYAQTSLHDPHVSVPNILMPPPSFPPRNSPAVQSQMLPPKTVSWQVQNPPPPPMMFPPNHVQPIIRGNFLPSHIPTMGMPPQNVTASMLPPSNSVPLMSQVRHLQLTTHGVMPNNPLIHSVPMNISQLQLPHMSHGVTNSMAQLHNLPAQGSSVVRLMSVHNQLPNMAVNIQNQHIANVLHNQNMSHFLTSHNQIQTQATMVAPNSDKLLKDSPAKEKSEVVDMDVDSPYSPGDSPSVDSNYDYSPPISPGQKSSPLVPHSKDPFDNLVGTDKDNSRSTPSKNSSKNRLSTNYTDTPNKKAKLDSRSEAYSKSRHSIRLQVADSKGKSRKEQKLSEKKDLFTKLDDTQLKILDELPSSAVEMQVKEKFLKKLNRQERVIEEVKLVLKPYYKTREVNKEEYKDILRKSVPKICHNKSGEINPVKVKNLVESYVKKVKHSRRKAKRHKASKQS